MGNKKGITLLALVITIVIILLLAGITLQMTMGENGLIAKSEQAKKEQAKSELYDTVKSSYAALSLRAIRNDKDKPNVEEVFNTADFTDRYNIVGDNITDKKGTVIDTKENVLNLIQGTVGGGFTTGTTTPVESWPKIVGGVTIPEEDKDKMILKLKVKSDTKVVFAGYWEPFEIDPMEIDYGNGEKDVVTNLYIEYGKQYSPGEYVIKIKDVRDFSMRRYGDYEIEILQWGKITEKNEQNNIEIPNVSKVYEPEPDRIPIRYLDAKFTEIPEWLFSKKVTSTVISRFNESDAILTIPEGLFKNNINIKKFEKVFEQCRGITNIPEGLFKNNTEVTEFGYTFSTCTGLTSIPEGLFKNNVNVTNFEGVFSACIGITSIPEGLFKNNVNVTSFSSTFNGCSGLTSIPEGLFKNNVNVTNFMYTFSICKGITNIPEGLFKNNVNVTNFIYTFSMCKGITNIPEGLFKNNVNVTSFSDTFSICTGIINIPEGLFANNINATDFSRLFYACKNLTNIPEGLFKNNVNATNFMYTFNDCEGLISIPEGLFKNNVNVTSFAFIFAQCKKINNVPEKIIEAAKRVKDKGGSTAGMFRECEALPDGSLPNYIR